MNQEKKWMLMTYYCPTHGDPGRIEPVEIRSGEISKPILKNKNSNKKV